MLNIAVLVSGGGTNLQALIDAQKAGKIKNGKIAAVISSREDAYALKRAENTGIPCHVVPAKDYKNRKEFTRAVVEKLLEVKADLVVMAGFLYVLDPEIFDYFTNKIINIHPSLIPAFCGDGYYGIHVHEKVLEYGVKLTGATAHFVTSETDGGPIILQKAVAVTENDTPAVLQRRVMEQAEWIILPEAVSLFCERRLKIEGRIVRILPSLDN